MSPQAVRQRGFAAIAAMFLMVVLAALGAFMVTFSNTEQLTSAQDVRGTRAYWAARAGLEWGISTAMAGAANACSAPSTALGNIEGLAVAVTCSVQTYTEGGVARNIFQITSQSSAGAVGTIGYIERSVSASLER